MEWLLFTSQLPASPSRLRVMVWRRMKAAGAVLNFHDLKELQDEHQESFQG